MNSEILALTQGIRKNSPALNDVIESVQKELGINLPEPYVEWLRYANGGAGSIGNNSYLQLWAVEKLITLNNAYQVEKFAPGLILFGSDGGGEGYAFDKRGATLPIVKVPFIGMSLEEASPIGETFLDFLNHLKQA